MNRIVLLSLAGLFFCGAGGVLLNIMPVMIFKLAGLFLFYLGGSVLLLNTCSFQMCSALLICGVGVSVLLATSQKGISIKNPAKDYSRTSLLFRIVLALMSGILAYTSSETLHYWVPVRKSVLLVVLWNSIMCLFSLSLDDILFYRCVYLQSVCLSFTVVYIYMENAVLVFAFFAVINLLMAFGESVLLLGGELPVPKEQSEDDV